MTAAKEAGMFCVVTPSEFALDHDFSRADIIAKDLDNPCFLSLENCFQISKSDSFYLILFILSFNFQTLGCSDPNLKENISNAL